MSDDIGRFFISKQPATDKAHQLRQGTLMKVISAVSWLMRRLSVRRECFSVGESGCQCADYGEMRCEMAGNERREKREEPKDRE